MQETRATGQCVDSLRPWAHPPDCQNPARASTHPNTTVATDCVYGLGSLPNLPATPECVAVWRGHGEDDVGPCMLIRAGLATADKPRLPGEPGVSALP